MNKHAWYQYTTVSADSLDRASGLLLSFFGNITQCSLHYQIHQVVACMGCRYLLPSLHHTGDKEIRYTSSKARDWTSNEYHVGNEA